MLHEFETVVSSLRLCFNFCSQALMVTPGNEGVCEVKNQGLRDPRATLDAQRASGSRESVNT